MVYTLEHFIVIIYQHFLLYNYCKLATTDIRIADCILNFIFKTCNTLLKWSDPTKLILKWIKNAIFVIRHICFMKKYCCSNPSEYFYDSILFETMLLHMQQNEIKWKKYMNKYITFILKFMAYKKFHFKITNVFFLNY